MKPFALLLCLMLACPVMACDKPPFKERHPKIYRAAKMTRTTCRFMLPVVQAGGAVAQIIVMFLI